MSEEKSSSNDVRTQQYYLSKSNNNKTSVINPLIAIHAGLGEFGTLAFLWVFIELLNPTKTRIKRAKIVALIGTLFLLSSWFLGGYYYVVEYGSLVKPIIKSGAERWVHSIIMETKEHVFLFLPFLAIFTTIILYKISTELEKNKKLKLAFLLLTILIVLLGFSIAGMGVMISSGFRSTLQSIKL